MKLLINKADDISYTTALECVKICLENYDIDKMKDRLFVFDKLKVKKRVLVYTRKDKETISFNIHYEVEK